MIKYLLSYGFVILFLTGCMEKRPSYAVKELIFPDYRDVTIPVNIAPLSFYVNLPEKDEDVRVLLRTKACELNRGGKDISFSIQEWRDLITSDSLLSVFIQVKNNRLWANVDSFNIYISADLVDPYLSYRLIEPGYEVWGNMGIYQRCLTNYEESVIYENSTEKNTCVNCHITNGGNPEEYIFHQRPKPAGTILVKDGIVSRLSTDYSEKIKALVYPSWHPSGKYIAFSVNKTVQAVHSLNKNRIEVMDLHSDIVILDIHKNVLLTSAMLSSDDAYETFPCFSPDGKKLYFCSAPAVSLPDSFNRVHYNLCSLDIDLEKGILGGKLDTIIQTDTLKGSISFPKISPSGRFLLYTRHAYGNFSIWHRDADLCMFDLYSQSEKDVSVLNSEETESYHSWSSEGRWIVFSSRRMTGLFTCLYIAHVDSQGVVGKPFLLPQNKSDYYLFQYKSYNVPEFMKGKIQVDRKRLKEAMGG